MKQEKHTDFGSIKFLVPLPSPVGKYDIIKIDLKRIVYGRVKWIHLVQVGSQ